MLSKTVLCSFCILHSLNEKITEMQFIFLHECCFYFPVSSHFYTRSQLLLPTQQLSSFSLSCLHYFCSLHWIMPISIQMCHYFHILGGGKKILILTLIPTAILQLAPHFSAPPNINTFQSYPRSFSTISFLPIFPRSFLSRHSLHCNLLLSDSYEFHAAKSDGQLNLTSFFSVSSFGSSYCL